MWGLEYQYPFSYDWSTEEVIDVVAFFQTVEKAYEKGMTKNEFMHAYRRFKEIVPGKQMKRSIAMSLRMQVDIPPIKCCKK